MGFDSDWEAMKAHLHTYASLLGLHGQLERGRLPLGIPVAQGLKFALQHPINLTLVGFFSIFFP